MMLNTPNDICQVETNVDILIMTSTLQTNIHSIKTRAQLISSVPVNKILLWRQVHLTGFFKSKNYQFQQRMIVAVILQDVLNISDF